MPTLGVPICRSTPLRPMRTSFVSAAVVVCSNVNSPTVSDWPSTEMLAPVHAHAERPRGDGHLVRDRAERLAAVVVLIWSEIAPVVNVKSVLRLDESANVTSVMFAAMPALSTRIWPLAIVTVTNVWLPLPSSSRTCLEIDRDDVCDLGEREAAAQPLPERLEVDVGALDRDRSQRACERPSAADGLRRRRRVQLHLERPADADARDVHRDRRLDAAEGAARSVSASRTPLPFETVTKSRWSVPSRSATCASVIRVSVTSSAGAEGGVGANLRSTRSTVKSPREALAEDRDRKARDRDADVTAGLERQRLRAAVDRELLVDGDRHELAVDRALHRVDRHVHEARRRRDRGAEMERRAGGDVARDALGRQEQQRAAVRDVDAGVVGPELRSRFDTAILRIFVSSDVLSRRPDRRSGPARRRTSR